ncbi:contact-dependent growth inhibition system immunity protein [Sodalis sp. RH23]|uniref:contact-dependent growth inhibition system immunity protein n=1 Tax=unclassified Sodalis (in: enterobacteria) TaxID=2636512 RepID=UPI0039B6574F
MSAFVKSEWATILSNQDFICISTCSGYRGGQRDPKGVQHIIDPKSADDDVGLLILDALSHSRLVLPRFRQDVVIHPDTVFEPEFYDNKLMEERYDAWVEYIMKRFSYKNENQMYKQLKNCSLTRTNGQIIFTPWHHKKLANWDGDGLTDADKVIIPASSVPTEIGAGLRLALSRCTG